MKAGMMRLYLLPLLFKCMLTFVIDRPIGDRIFDRSCAMSDISPQEDNPKRAFVFGLGYVGLSFAKELRKHGWQVSGTCSSVIKAREINDSEGISAYAFNYHEGRMNDEIAIRDLGESTCILSTIPPTENLRESEFDPVLSLHIAELLMKKAGYLGLGNLSWVGYLSSTGVYGDRKGSWVSESDLIGPDSPKTRLRAEAELEWMECYHKYDLPVHIFRLAGVYGPGRSAIEVLESAGGDMSKCKPDPISFVSRIHVADAVNVLMTSLDIPQPGLILNVADNMPSTRYDVLSYVCRCSGYPIIPALTQEYDLSTASLPIPPSPAPRLTRGGSKRVDNSRMRLLLSRASKALRYPDYRAGLDALLAQGKWIPKGDTDNSDGSGTRLNGNIRIGKDDGAVAAVPRSVEPETEAATTDAILEALQARSDEAVIALAAVSVALDSHAQTVGELIRTAGQLQMELENTSKRIASIRRDVELIVPKAPER